MPIRKSAPKQASLKKMIEPLYTRPLLKYLAWAEDHALLATLIYGPPCGLNAMQRAKLSDQDVANLTELWQKMREDILAAQAEYAPEQEPWGCRFDGGQQ